MCASALIKQHVKSLGLRYNARIDLNVFQDVFEFRKAGHKINIPKALEESFLSNPKTDQERHIADLIREWRQSERERLTAELHKQTARLATAEEKLKIKATKTNSEEVRKASGKVALHTRKLKELDGPTTDEARIFPFVFAPLIVFENGERVIKPFRYQLRRAGSPASVDFELDTYNARRDSLKEKNFWQGVYGKKHGVLVMSRFYENVSRDDKNCVLEFEPQGLQEILVPCVFDYNEEGEFTLHSFAIITDEPNNEVKEAGHDRTPIVMKEKHLDLWLNTNGRPLQDFEVVFDDKQPTYFKHKVVEG